MLGSLLFTVVAAAGVWAMLPSSLSRLVRLSVIGVVSLALLPLAWWLTHRMQPPPITARPAEVRSDGFVGSATCQMCHSEQHRSWHASYHRSMTQLVSEEAVRAPFDGREVIVDQRKYRFYRRGTEFWVAYEETFLQGTGPDRYRQILVMPPITSQSYSVAVEKQIVMTTGSHHYQVYWFETGDDRILAHIPIVYLIEEERWIPRQSAFVVPTACAEKAYAEHKGVGAWNIGCIRCHATNPNPHIVTRDDGQEVFDSLVGEFGISCEACHGPGAEHVAANQNPLRRYRAHHSNIPDPTIQNPAKMDHRRSSETCGRCHSVQDASSPELYTEWMTQGDRFRPGDDITESRLIVNNANRQHPRMDEFLRGQGEYLDNTHWSDGMVRIAGREYNGLLDAPCFQRGEMSCLSCHVMHQPEDDTRPVSKWAAGQMKVAMQGNQACLQCHQEIGDDLTAHTHHAAESAGSSCYNCHMPHTSYGLLKGVRTHQITSPDIAATRATGRPDACSMCHLDRPLSWTAQHLHEWYGHPLPELSKDEQQVAASLRWLLTGDAAQRVLVTWTLGWPPAQQASGNQWIAPYLGQMLEDPYAAIRLVAHRSLQTLPGFSEFEYDHLMSPPQRSTARASVWEQWKQQSESIRSWPGAVLISDSGSLQENEVERLLRKRDNRPLLLSE